MKIESRLNPLPDILEANSEPFVMKIESMLWKKTY